jgi:predicted secreted protein
MIQLITLAVALASASRTAPTPLPSLPPGIAKLAMPTFTAKDASIVVRVNQPFQIRLKVNSGTGYTWRPQAPIPPGLTLLGVFQEARGKIMPGGPGQEVLVFRASDVGKVHLALEYVRPWERSPQPAKVQAYTLSIHR